MRFEKNTVKSTIQQETFDEVWTDITTCQSNNRRHNNSRYRKTSNKRPRHILEHGPWDPRV